MVYLDAASTEPLHPAARDALLSALDSGWADPARLYGAARRAQMLLEQARADVAEVIGARPDEVAFTSSGTQAVHLGVLGTLNGRRRVGDRLVTGAVEHSSVLHAAEEHERGGGTAEVVGVSRTGRVDVELFARAVSAPGTALACLQTANHEVGTLQPVEEAAAACREAGVPLLVDAAQSAGRLPLPAAGPC
ncbi:aminotransferase class V-fold PLP-dependent enzyme [Microtetraspora malaysiensis]|uniref:aminotransferase class V-fold PLP-dependent enzyme n=1 Tax=Microtetraspora malaysiensis TaxID=161358 RepID=UPI003D90AE6A